MGNPSSTRGTARSFGRASHATETSEYAYLIGCRPVAGGIRADGTASSVHHYPQHARLPKDDLHAEPMTNVGPVDLSPIDRHRSLLRTAATRGRVFWAGRRSSRRRATAAGASQDDSGGRVIQATCALRGHRERSEVCITVTLVTGPVWTRRAVMRCRPTGRPAGAHRRGRTHPRAAHGGPRRIKPVRSIRRARSTTVDVTRWRIISRRAGGTGGRDGQAGRIAAFWRCRTDRTAWSRLQRGGAGAQPTCDCSGMSTLHARVKGGQIVVEGKTISLRVPS